VTNFTLDVSFGLVLNKANDLFLCKLLFTAVLIIFAIYE
jgi:hypothetical protein